MRWPRGAIGAQPGELAFALDQSRVGIENIGELAMQADADLLGKLRMLLDERSRRTHEKCEMGDVVGVGRAEHEDLVLGGLFAVQAVAAIKHEYLERGHPVLEREIFHLAEMAVFDRRYVIAVVD